MKRLFKSVSAILAASFVFSSAWLPVLADGDETPSYKDNIQRFAEYIVENNERDSELNYNIKGLAGDYSTQFDFQYWEGGTVLFVMNLSSPQSASCSFGIDSSTGKIDEYIKVRDPNADESYYILENDSSENNLPVLSYSINLYNHNVELTEEQIQINNETLSQFFTRTESVLQTLGFSLGDFGFTAYQNVTPTVTPTETPEPTATNTPEPVATNTPVPTATVAPTATNTPVPPTATSTPKPTATNTPVPTATSTPKPTATNTPVPTATSTPKPTATSTPVPTATSTPVPTATVAPTATNTPVPPTATSTPKPTATNTPVPTATSTPKPTATSTPVPTATSTPVPTATNTPKPTATSTPKPTATNTPVPTATSTPEPTATETPEPTATNTPEPTATNTPTPLPAERWTRCRTTMVAAVPAGVSLEEAIAIAQAKFKKPYVGDCVIYGVAADGNYLNITFSSEGWVDNTPLDMAYILNDIASKYYWYVIGDVVTAENDDIASFAERIYTCALGREAEPAGRLYWYQQLKAGASAAAIAHDFLFSAEVANSGISDSEFIVRLYKTFMNREPAEAEIEYWLGAMNGSREAAFAGFVNSQEWADLCYLARINSGSTVAPKVRRQPSAAVIGFATRLYTTCLGRDAEDAGVAYWADILANEDATGRGVAYSYFFGDEFTAQNNDNAEIIARLYRTLMGREGSEDEITYWLSTLQYGSTIQDIFNGFAGSPEFAGICADAGIKA